MESGEIGEWIFPQKEGRSLTDISKFALTEFPNLHTRHQVASASVITWHSVALMGQEKGRRIVKRFSYGERDYAFGQLIATLRRQFKLTQAELAERLEVSRQAVGEWEAGSSYPKADHLKDFIGLGVQQHAFTTGREVEEIRTLWQAAHQKVLIDESWLQELLSQRHHRLTLVAKEQDEPSSTVKQALIQSTAEPRVDWGDALDVSSFYGREEELAELIRSRLAFGGEDFRTSSALT